MFVFVFRVGFRDWGFRLGLGIQGSGWVLGFQIRIGFLDSEFGLGLGIRGSGWV